MKKIILISPKDCNFYNFRREMILRLKELGYEVVLVCPYGDKIDYFTSRGISFQEISVDRRGKNVFRDLMLILAYYKLLRREKPDVVLTYTSKPSIYGGFVCGICKFPYIVNNAGLMEATGWLAFLLNRLYRIGFKKAECIMYQNTYEAEKINALLHYKTHYRHLPGSGVNLEEFKYEKYPDDGGPVIFNFVARIAAMKGIEEFLACAARIKRKYPNTRFVIYGEYDEEIYRAEIRRLESLGIVEYGGVKLDMKPYIANAHAVIHPSHYEGMTNVCLEHSAMGRVCIGADIPGVREIIDDGRTGFLFKVKDVDSMVLSVEKFLALSNCERAEMGKRARVKMENQFNREIVTDIYLEEINKIINRV